MARADFSGWSREAAVLEVGRLQAHVRDQAALIASLRAEIAQLKPQVQGPSVLTPAQELVHLRNERERLTKIARDRAITIRDMRRKLDAVSAAKS